jgi:hypothetical protein
MLRQLDQRNTAGMTITLEWDSATNRVFVTCVNGHAGHEPLLCYPVEPRDARFAFLHPFAATGLSESRSVEESPTRYAIGDWLPKQSPDNHSGTSDSDYGDGLDVTDATDNSQPRRRRWFDLRPSLRPFMGLTEFQYGTWWPL